ncbi:unnamed protein product [Schistocephalus solidus]|uniref:C2H2-type domain-containing protein n=1 Tax=Schistocephalus solidus TaxID=70667 RepID=A0A183SVZ0_SCHSO|nr:unnamed protein product [Schistocephalus solidus]
MHQQTDNSNFYVKFCQPSFGLPHPPGINSITPTMIETTSQYLSPVTSTTISDGDSLLNCPQCDRTFTKRIGLLIHLRIHRTETGKPVPGAPTYSRHRGPHRPPCSHTFTYRMVLLGHMRLHDNLP